MEETYTIGTVMLAVHGIIDTAREGGEAWEAMWSQIPSEHNAEQVRGVFARSDWFGAVCLDTRDGIKSEAFLLTELLCDLIVRRFGLFTRSKVGVIS